MEEQSKEIQTFARRRRTLNERLDATRKQVDEMITSFESRAPTLQEIALFQGLLDVRAGYLRELSQFHEEFLDYLLLLTRGRGS